MLAGFSNIFKIPELRTRVLWTLFYLVVFRLGSFIPLPGIEVERLGELQKQIQGGPFGMMLMFTGSALENASIFSLGIMPYISASIIFSLLAKIWPTLEALAKEGAAGQRKINQYTRYATVPLCIIQSLFVLNFLSGTQQFTLPLVSNPSIWWYLQGILVITTGSIFLIWLGEQITEYGVGNGISLLIMAGIVARMPYEFIGIWYQPSGKIFVLVLAFLYVLVVAGVIVMTQGQRRILVQQAKHTRGRRQYGGQQHYIPIRVNMAGVMPVIFASSLMIFPMVVCNWLGVKEALYPTSFWYVVSYIVLVFFFTFFWTSLMFQPTEMANNMKEWGSFIPGIRPGPKTAEFLEKIMVNVSVAGAAFLALIALFPQVVAGTMGLQAGLVSFLGGTGLLIVVGVTLDVVQKLESHLLMRHYEGFMRRGRIRGRRGWA